MQGAETASTLFRGQIEAKVGLILDNDGMRLNLPVANETSEHGGLRHSAKVHLAPLVARSTSADDDIRNTHRRSRSHATRMALPIQHDASEWLIAAAVMLRTWGDMCALMLWSFF